MQIIPFQLKHIERLKEQGIQSEQLTDSLDSASVKALAAGGITLSVVDGDRVLFCGGVIKIWEGRGLAWGVFPKDVGHLFIGVHRAVRRWFADCGIRRIEADIRTDFKPAHRWIKLLGFEYEGTRRAFCPLGNDYDLYALVRRTV